MPLTAENRVLVRGWVGAEPDDAALDALYDQFLNHDAVVDHVLRNRIATLSLEPSSVTVPGLSISHGSDLQALQELYKNWKASPGLGLEEDSDTTKAATGKLNRRYPR